MKPHGIEALPSLETLAANPAQADPERVGREFEALLLGEIMKRAFAETGIRSTLGDGSAGRMYRELFAEEIARRIAFGRGSGLPDLLAPRSGQAEASGEEVADG